MLGNALEPGSFLAHGYCLSWRPDLVALHLGSDLITGMAYFSIPVAIFAFLRHKPEFEYRWVAHLFAVFIFLCGTTHVFGAATLWLPYYELDGLIKAVTALVSAATAVTLWPLLPRLLSLPSPRQLQEANRRLEAEIQERRAVEQALREARDELERRVLERTAELARSEERARLAAEAADVGTWDWDLGTDRISTSPRCRDILGIATGDATSPEDFLRTIHPQDRAMVEAGLRRAVQDGVFRADFRAVLAGGRTRWVEGRGRVLRETVSGTGRPRRLLGTVTDVTERIQTAQTLRQSLAEKETLLREVHHRVKNNLQSLLALLRLEERRSRNPSLSARFDAMRLRIQVMSNIHHSLYAAETLARVDFGHQLQELCDNLRHLLPPDGRIAIEARTDSLWCDLDTAIPLAMLVNEIVLNAVKHAFPENRSGLIQVTLARKDKAVELRVADDGIGDLSAPEAEGTDEGIGKMLIGALARQLEAAIETEVASGTRVRITLPEPLFTDNPVPAPTATGAAGEPTASRWPWEAGPGRNCRLA